jgi:hypothetical protein
MAIRRWFMAYVNPNVAYVDLFVMSEKTLMMPVSLNNTYLINNNSLLFTNHLKQ